MRRLRWIAGITLIACGAAVYWSCGTLQPLTGGTSETTNGITAVVLDTMGVPVANATVHIRVDTYLTDTSKTVPNNAPITLIDTVTDHHGRFSTGPFETGDYAVEIQDENGCGAFLTVPAQKNRTVNCGSITVRPNGRIYGVVDLTTIPEKSMVYVQVYGLERLVRIDTVTGSFIVNNLPQGSYTLRIKPSLASFDPAEIADNIVSSDSATGIGIIEFEPYEKWPYSREILLNTDPSGADVDETVVGFPVLIRCAHDNFPFSQAAGEGRDIRFSKRDGTPLPYEIEGWDPVAGHAEVWVRCDTIYGNNSTQSIVMYWGNADARDASNSAAVFDTADGFVGVWHLREEAAGRGNSDVYRDATAHHYDGRDDIGATGREGHIGYGKTFDNAAYDSASGICDDIVLPSSSQFVPSTTSPLTISMWMNIGELKNDLNRLFTIHKGDTLGSGFILGIYKKDSISLTLYTRGAAPGYPFYSVIPTGGWQYGTLTYGAGYWRLYVNGTLMARDTASSHEAGGAMNAVIGGFGACWVTEPGFDGALDEVRFEKTARSPSWIRLSYMNQHAENKLVVIK
ncbi:MAG: DUF2341 domain-containing protein [Chitinispirillaceae bacterium]|nr:DUF2341 domain-containing protein [Chitinispirillaceae bacterium]